MAVLWMAVRLLRREWRSGELAVLLVSLSVAVAALTGVGFLVDRIARAVYRADPDRAPGPGFGLRGVRTGTAAQRCRSCGHAAGAAGEPHAVRPAAGGLRKSPGPLRRVVHGARASRGAPGAHRRRQPADWRRGAAREPLPVPGQPRGAAAVRRGAGPPPGRLWLPLAPAAAAIAGVIYGPLGEWRFSLWFVAALAAALLCLALSGALLVALAGRVRGGASLPLRHGLANLSRRRAAAVAPIVAVRLRVLLLPVLSSLRPGLGDD